MSTNACRYVNVCQCMYVIVVCDGMWVCRGRQAADRQGGKEAGR